MVLSQQMSSHVLLGHLVILKDLKRYKNVAPAQEDITVMNLGRLPTQRNVPQVCMNGLVSRSIENYTLLHAHCITNQILISHIGYYCRSGATVSTPETIINNTTKICQPGTFNYTDAGPCPIGFYCPLGTDQPKKCSPGTFSNVSKLAAVEQCQNCTAGYYCGEYNMTTVSGPCQEGYYCPTGASKADWIPCPPGKYCITGSSGPERCPRGTFRNITMAKSISECYNCTPGFYCEREGLTEVTGPCAPRYYVLQML